ncbi:MAG: YceI family protein [Bacteroidia bacterium]|nr:YceI family protein [Bacteroidia bacterium]
MSTATTTLWAIDPTHSSIQFKVKHLVISTVTGEFTDYSATVQAPAEGFEGAKVSFEAQVASISTGVGQRDDHLRSADFFDAQTYPTLRFESTRFAAKGADAFELEGHLTIRDTTLPVVLAVEFGGVVVDPYGQTKAGFELTGKISRKAFGLTWNATTEAGGVVVGDEIKLVASVQLVKQAA